MTLRGKRTPDELKYIDAYITPTATPLYSAGSGSGVTLLNGISQGDDATNRDGRVIYMRGMNIVINCYYNTTCVAPQYVKWGIFYDTACCGTQVNLSDIWTFSAGVANQGQRNLDNRSRFTCLAEGQMVIGSTTGVDCMPNARTLQKYIKMPNLKTVYNGTGNTYGACQQGALWFAICGQVSGAGTTGTVYSFTARLRYVG